MMTPILKTIQGAIIEFLKDRGTPDEKIKEIDKICDEAVTDIYRHGNTVEVVKPRIILALKAAIGIK